MVFCADQRTVKFDSGFFLLVWEFWCRDWILLDFCWLQCCGCSGSQLKILWLKKLFVEFCRRRAVGCLLPARSGSMGSNSHLCSGLHRRMNSIGRYGSCPILLVLHCLIVHILLVYRFNIVYIQNCFLIREVL